MTLTINASHDGSWIRRDDGQWAGRATRRKRGQETHGGVGARPHVRACGMHTRACGVHARAQQADLIRSVDAGAPVQKQPRNLQVAFSSSINEARIAVLRSAGGGAGTGGSRVQRQRASTRRSCQEGARWRAWLPAPRRMRSHSHG
jgi:hypothetical protein